MNRKALGLLGAVTGVTLLAAACGSTSSVGTTTPQVTAVSCKSGNQLTPNYHNGIPTVSGGASSLSGAGSTFVAPMMSQWTSSYSSQKGVQVAYAAVGSGAGVQQVIANTVDFGDSDVPMTATEQSAAKGPVLHIPVVLGAVVPIYNIPGVPSGLKFTGNVLGQIFVGTVTNWNDPAIAQLNPGSKLPNLPIAVAHRSDGSGTTGIFTTYLTKTSSVWVTKLGGPTTSEGKTVAWPVGLGGKGNDGVAALVRQTQGGIGYVELQYAIAQGLNFGQVKNAAGNFVQACVATVNAAAGNVTFPPTDHGDLTNEPNSNAWPITGTTYSLVYQAQTDKAKAAALVNFFSWVLTTGQNQASTLNYAPLGSGLQQQSIGQLRKITVNGTTVAP